ncbi:MAG TPA: thioredoxin family protein [Pseudoxanthomonas sp.]|nr:thioredoxin family protein [Pseudoxanthomonas sp.]
MRRHLPAVFAITLAWSLSACGVAKAPTEPNPPTVNDTVPAAPDPSRPVASGNTEIAADVAAAAGLRAHYDPRRDPAKDLETAKVEAVRGGKRIVLDVGSESCLPCQRLDDEIEAHAELRSARDAGLVWVKVNADAGNPNAAFLAAYPPFTAEPHLVVLDAAGAPLHAQPGLPFTQGGRASRKALLAFLRQWSSPQDTAPAAP